MATRSKAWVYGSSLPGIVGSNLAGGMDVCLCSVLCVVRYKSLRRADHSSREALPNVMRRSVWSRHLKNQAVARVEAQRHRKKMWCLCILIVMYVLFCVLFCVNVTCTTTNACQPNCSSQIYQIKHKKIIKFTLGDKRRRIHFYCCSKPSPK